MAGPSGLAGVWGRGRSRRRSLWWSTVEGTLGIASDNWVAPYLGLYALAMGAGPLGVSLATAAPIFFGYVLQLPFGWLAERLPRRRPLWLLGNAVARALWIPVGLLPWLVPDRRQLLLGYGVLLVLRGLFAAMAVPAWTALMADLTERSWRGSYFAVRNVLANAAAFASTVVAGHLVNRWGYPAGYGAIFGAASLVGAASVLAILGVEEPPAQRECGEAALAGRAAVASRPPAPPGRGFVARLRCAAGGWLVGGPARWRKEAPGFGTFAGTSLLWHLAVNLPAALFPVYFARELGGPPGLWGVANGAMLATTVLGQRWWGRLCDRLGQQSVLVWSGLGAALLPLWWAAVGSPVWVVGINLVAGYLWAGYNLAAFNLLLEQTPDRSRPSYVGLFNTGVGLAAAAGVMAGGWLAEQAAIRPVLVLSSVLRLGALGLFVWAVRPVIPRRPSWPDRRRWGRRAAGSITVRLPVRLRLSRGTARPA